MGFGVYGGIRRHSAAKICFLYVPRIMHRYMGLYMTGTLSLYCPYVYFKTYAYIPLLSITTACSAFGYAWRMLLCLSLHIGIFLRFSDVLKSNLFFDIP